MLKGYKRVNGKFGIRNKILIVALDECCDGVAKNIASQFNDVVVFTNHYTCMYGGNEEIFMQIARVCKNPNIATVLVVSMGCGSMPVDILLNEVSPNKPIYSLCIIDKKGSKNTIKEGIEKIKEFKSYADSLVREDFDFSKLVIGIKCGGSDTISGIGSNPCIGDAVDKLIDMGASAIGGELIELLGCEDKLAERISTEEGKSKIKQLIKLEADRWNIEGAETESMSIGNCVGGLTTLEEKSFGALYKMGTKPVKGILQFNQQFIDEIKDPGFYLSEATHLCGGSAVNFLSLDAHLILWSTAGAAFDNALIPTIKISANKEAFNDDMDIDACSIIDGSKSYSNIGDDIVKKVIDICNGEKTNTESYSNSFLTLYQKDVRLEKKLNIDYKKCIL